MAGGEGEEEDGPGGGAAAGGKKRGPVAPIKDDPEGGLALQEGPSGQQPLPGLSAKGAAAAQGEPPAPCPLLLLLQKPPGEDEDDAWHYNSFQYWRSPLPAINLRDILDLEKDGPLEARDSSSVALSEMET